MLLAGPMLSNGFADRYKPLAVSRCNPPVELHDSRPLSLCAPWEQRVAALMQPLHRGMPTTTIEWPSRWGGRMLVGLCSSINYLQLHVVVRIQHSARQVAKVCNPVQRRNANCRLRQCGTPHHGEICHNADAYVYHYDRGIYAHAMPDFPNLMCGTMPRNTSGSRADCSLLGTRTLHLDAPQAGLKSVFTLSPLQIWTTCSFISTLTPSSM